MNKSIKRSLVITGIVLVAFVLLIPLVALAQSQSSSPDESQPETIRLERGGEPGQATICGSAVISKEVSFWSTCIPYVSKIDFDILGGEIRLAPSGTEYRIRGLTTFVPEPVILDFRYLDFSTLDPPDEMKIWFAGTPEPSTTISYQEMITLTDIFSQNPVTEPGGYPLQILFRQTYVISNVTYSVTSPVQNFTFFYIPEGDFEGGNLTDDWDEYVIPFTTTVASIAGGKLQLGRDNEAYSCTEADQSMFGVSLIMEMPADSSDFTLHIEGEVYTQDVNPNNDDSYDAFEIGLNGDVVVRRSNQELPVFCPSDSRIVPIEAHIPLDGYSGFTALTLENHLRFDDYFNTYTEIETVWIDD